eukprot:TRINITY_DN57367_c0_g1_i1.p1 TRINITY_DN57367_c0_g1~~TRINITY_DN57367_c0_g1_i1.p1  ORF type:complete len:216 (-),score=40.49 TRINITY_DN57367_c0_g1_i1:9-629(-)
MADPALGSQGLHDATTKQPEQPPKASKSSKHFDNIIRKVNVLQDCQDKQTLEKEKALEHLIKSQEAFEAKTKELNDCESTYKRVMKALNDKRAKRDHLIEQVGDCNFMMNSMVQTTLTNSRKALANVKVRNGKYHTAERDAARGYTANKDAAPHRQVPLSFTNRTKMMGGGIGKSSFGATATGVLGTSASAPALTGDLGSPSPLAS